MHLNNSKIIVIKIGSSLLVDHNKKVRKKWLISFAKDVQKLKFKNKKIVILDIPLLLENKINKKNDILVYVDSPKSDILIRLKKRKNFNQKMFKN